MNYENMNKITVFMLSKAKQSKAKQSKAIIIYTNK